jgi:hypothetical protein
MEVSTIHISAIAIDAEGIFHPETEAQIIELVRFAKQHAIKIRAFGSKGSEKPAYSIDQDLDISMMLDRVCHIQSSESDCSIRVGGGCFFSLPNYQSVRFDTQINQPKTILDFLKEKGWALSNLSSTVNETIAGQISTGSSGASYNYDFYESILSIRVVDGNGEVRVIDQEHPDFGALGISLGLLGIITEVTLQCEPEYRVKGVEYSKMLGKNSLELLNQKKMEEFFSKHDYAQIYWVPQFGINRVHLWEVNRCEIDQPKKKYANFFKGQYMIGVLGRFYTRVWNRMYGPKSSKGIIYFLSKFITSVYKTPLAVFAKPSDQDFCDEWSSILPVNNYFDNRYMNVQTMELIFPFSKASEIFKFLDADFQEKKIKATHFNPFCIRSSKASRFWLSPAYGEPCIKIDIGHLAPASMAYFQYMYEALKPFGVRLHWGKVLFTDPDYIHSHFPRLKDFLELRSIYDPEQIFVSDFWRKIFAIDSGKSKVITLKENWKKSLLNESNKSQL